MRDAINFLIAIDFYLRMNFRNTNNTRNPFTTVVCIT